MHHNRVWSVVPVESAEELARMLTKETWCCCNGFQLLGYWFLNDATSEDGAQEYGVVKIRGPNDRLLQVESITMSWCSYEEALSYIQRAISGAYDTLDFSRIVDLTVETSEQHKRCPLCA